MGPTNAGEINRMMTLIQQLRNELGASIDEDCQCRDTGHAFSLIATANGLLIEYGYDHPERTSDGD